MDADFHIGTIAPFAVIGEAWARIKDQYWLFLGITCVGMLLGSAAPFGILMGPMMCGIFLCFLNQRRGIPVRFEMVFQGFERFKEAFIASLIMMAAGFVIAIPLAGIAILLAFATIAAGASGRASGDLPVWLLLAFGVGFLLFMLFAVVVGVLFSFTFPLIIHRRLDGVAAVKLSARAALPNFWGLLGLGLVNMAMSMLGLCFCYVGAFLVLPLTLGTHWVAYERVFGGIDPA